MTQNVHKWSRTAPLLTKEGCPVGRGGSQLTERINVNNLPELKTFRTELRKRLTPAEAAFWNIVKRSRLDGRKFRRQHSVGRYILDFYCPQENLAVELDGGGHYSTTGMLYDRERRLFVEYFGIKVLRFENKLIFDDLEWVIANIRDSFGWKERTTPFPTKSVGPTPPL